MNFMSLKIGKRERPSKINDELIRIDVSSDNDNKRANKQKERVSDRARSFFGKSQLKILGRKL